MTNVVLGSGPVGQIMALTLSLSGQNVCLIGPSAKPLPSMAFSILPKYFRLLQSLGLQPKANPIYDLTIDLKHPYTLKYEQPIAYIVRYNDLLQQLAIRLKTIEHIPALALDINHNQVQLPSQSILFQNLIACDGQHSQTRDKLGIQAESFPYHQFAHTAIITHTSSQKGISQVFRHYGSFGKLTLPNPYQSAIVWSCDTTTHQSILKDGLKTSLKKLKLIHDILIIEHHSYTPLSATIAQSYYKGNVFLAGNALHSVHPLAGIGFNLALGDIDALNDIICCKRPAKTYEAKRRKVHAKAHWITHKIAQSREYDDYYPLIGQLGKYTFGLSSTKSFVLRQWNSLC